MVQPLTDYAARLQQAMRLAGIDPDSTTAANWLRDRLGVTYQAAKKAIGGETKMLQADNNVKAAKALNVCSEWLATGEGSMTIPAWRQALSAPAMSLATLFDEQVPEQLRQTTYTMIVNQIESAAALAREAKEYAAASPTLEPGRVR